MVLTIHISATIANLFTFLIFLLFRCFELFSLQKYGEITTETLKNRAFHRKIDTM